MIQGKGITIKSQIPEEEKTVTPTTSQQIVTPTNGLLRKVTVEGVTSSIDPDIQPENIKQGVDILGVEGTLKPPVLIEKTITENGVYNAKDDNADGYSEVTVNIQPLFSVNGVMYFKDMVIPGTVSSIKANAYQGCTMMETLEIAGSVKKVGAYAFQNCHITSLVLHNGIEVIQSFAFTNHRCTFVEIPDSVIQIGDYAFSSPSVGQIYDLTSFLDPLKIPTLGANVFLISSVQSFLVANQEMLEAFSAATNWSTYADKFQIKEA